LGAARLFDTGSLPVFAAGDGHVLKLYPPCFAHERAHEQSVLSRLHGRLPLATPRVVSSGEVDGWQYAVMDRIPGTSLDEVWGTLSPGERIGLAEELGGFLRALHALDVEDGSDVSGEWLRFMTEQARRCEDLQRRQSLAPRWLEQIQPFLSRVELAPLHRPVWLHTEIMRAHGMAVRNGQG
jgi:hygromycin-B 7''-O-kinase